MADPGDFARRVAAEMAKLQSDGSRGGLQELKGQQQGLLADARSALAEQKSRAVIAQEMERRESALIKLRMKGEQELATVRARFDLEAGERAKKAEERKAAAEKRSVDRQAKKEAKEVSDLLKSGGEFVAHAALGLAAAAAGVVAAGITFGVHVSEAQRKQKASLDALTYTFANRGTRQGVAQGDIAFRVTMSLAGEKGVPPDEALSRVKRLIDAKFGRAETETVFRVAADIEATRGGAAAEAYVSQVEALKRLDTQLKDQERNRLRDWKAIEIERGQGEVAALARMADAGVKQSDVLTRLARKGEDLRTTMMRLRRGQIDLAEFSKALSAEAGKGLGGVAGKGLDAQLNRIKIGFSDVFSGLDLGPLDKAGEIIGGMLSGAEGAKLKGALREAGQAAVDLLKPFQSEEGRKAIHDLFEAVADGARSAAKFLREVRGDIKEILEINAKQGAGAAALVAVGKAGGKIIGEGESMHLPGINVAGPGFVTFEQHREEVERAKSSGKAISDGMAKGVEENAPKVASAVTGAVRGAIDAGNQAAGIRSPSRVAAEQGKYYDLGWEQGIRDNADRPARAAAAMVRGVAGAGDGGGGSFSGSGGYGGASGGMSFTYAPVYQLPPGSTEQTVAAMREAHAIDYSRLLPLLRQVVRDQREGRFT